MRDGIHTGGLFPPPWVREGGKSQELRLLLTPLPTTFATRRWSTSPSRGEVTRGGSVPKAREMPA